MFVSQEVKNGVLQDPSRPVQKSERDQPGAMCVAILDELAEGCEGSGRSVKPSAPAVNRSPIRSYVHGHTFTKSHIRPCVACAGPGGSETGGKQKQATAAAAAGGRGGRGTQRGKR